MLLTRPPAGCQATLDDNRSTVKFDMSVYETTPERLPVCMQDIPEAIETLVPDAGTAIQTQ